jgi:copper chaperone
MKKITFFALIMACMVAIAFAGNTLNLSVKGMHCGGCEDNFKAKAEKLDGVINVSDVSATNATATIEYDAAKTSEQEIIAQLTKQTGYAIATATSATTTETTKTAASCCSKGNKAACTKPATGCAKGAENKSCGGK